MITKDVLLEYVKEQYKDEVRKRINEADNFFKHADRDPDSLFNFNRWTHGKGVLILRKLLDVFHLTRQLRQLMGRVPRTIGPSAKTEFFETMAMTGTALGGGSAGLRI